MLSVLYMRKAHRQNINMSKEGHKKKATATFLWLEEAREQISLRAPGGKHDLAPAALEL